MDRVKVLYEQHFLGIQKLAPETLHRQVERRMLQLTQHQIRNTGLRFRFTTLSQKFGAYNTYWRRTMRAIEQGRFTKHLQMAARRRQAQGKGMPDEMLANLPKRLRERIIKDRDRVAVRAERDAERSGESQQSQQSQEGPAVIRQAKPHRHEVDAADLGDSIDFDAMFDAIKTDDAPPAVRARPPIDEPDTIEQAPPAGLDDFDASFDAIMTDDPPIRPAAAPAPRPRPTPVPRARPTAGAKRDSIGSGLPAGMTEHQTRDLFDKYVKAKKLCGEPTDKVSYAKLLRTLNKQAPAIMKQHNATGVSFNVVVKGDKVVLKAKPKK